jgi:hypothetical protein
MGGRLEIVSLFDIQALPAVWCRWRLISGIVLQSAINLARYHARGEGDDEEIEITADMLRKVVENRTQYKNAIKAIDGLSESARAHDSGWIADSAINDLI